MFQGQCAPISNLSRLPLSPVGCAVAACTPSSGLIMNFLVKMSQGRISKLITRSLFFKINKYSHIVISLLPVKLLKNLTGRSEMTMWENLLISKNKERVMNFEILPCDFLTKNFVIKPTEGVNDNKTSYRRQQQSRYG